MEIGKFFGGRLATLGVEELILFVFISLMHWNSILVKLIAQVVIVILNYIISKIFVFKEKSKSKWQQFIGYMIYGINEL